MKKVLLTTILVLIFLSVFALKFDGRIPQDATPIKSPVKDSLAQAVGATALFTLDGQFYGQVPTCMTSIVYDTISGQILTTATVYDSNTGLFDGMYYTYSGDGGATWTAPAKFVDGMYYQHNSLDLADDIGIPYVAAVYRTASARGVLFTYDQFGVGGGGWTTPILITDSVNYAAYYNQIAVSPDGANVVLLAWDWMPADWRYGFNTSSDYGNTWGDYTTPSIWDPAETDCPFAYSEVSVARWGAGSTVYGIMGGEWRDYENRGVQFGLSVSTDNGVTWGAIDYLYNNETEGTPLPPFAEVSGETLTYYLDTIANGTADTIVVKAWFDDTLGIWVDEIGNIDGLGLGSLGSWWHYYDVEYVDGKMIFATPLPALTVDYIVDGDLYTFIDEWYRELVGYRDIAGGQQLFDWYLIDFHALPEDTLWTLSTWRAGYIGANAISYDRRDGSIYIIMDDLYDTLGIMSHDLIKIDPVGQQAWIKDAPVVLNSNADNLIEAPKIVDPNGWIHTTFNSGSDDSIYYIGFNVDSVSDWVAPNSVKVISGIKENNTFENVSILHAPSIVRDNAEISFSLANTSNVNISLYDVTGREIMNLANGTFSAGNHSVTINANKLSQGVYFAKINAGTISDSKRIIIVK